MVETAASQRQEAERELELVRKDCIDLRARADAAEEKGRVQVRRGKAELAEVVHQKNEMVGRGMR